MLGSLMVPVMLASTWSWLAAHDSRSCVVGSHGKHLLQTSLAVIQIVTTFHASLKVEAGYLLIAPCSSSHCSTIELRSVEPSDSATFRWSVSGW